MATPTDTSSITACTDRNGVNQFSCGLDRKEQKGALAVTTNRKRYVKGTREALCVKMPTEAAKGRLK